MIKRIEIPVTRMQLADVRSCDNCGKDYKYGDAEFVELRGPYKPEIDEYTYRLDACSLECVNDLLRAKLLVTSG